MKRSASFFVALTFAAVLRGQAPDVCQIPGLASLFPEVCGTGEATQPTAPVGEVTDEGGVAEDGSTEDLSGASVYFDALSYLLPPQHVDEPQRHYHLRGAFTLRLSQDCPEEWCGTLPVGKKVETKEISKYVEVARDPFGRCDREFVMFKQQSGTPVEAFCVVGNEIVIDREQLSWDDNHGLYRTFENGAYQVSYVGPKRGAHWTNEFTQRVYEDCNASLPDEVHGLVMGMTSRGPYDLDRELDKLVAVIRETERGNERALLRDMVETLKKTHRGDESEISLLLQQEYWGPFGGDTCAETPDKDRCFSWREDYGYVRINGKAVGRAFWQLNGHSRPQQPMKKMRITVIPKVKREGKPLLPLRICGGR